eukprot:scaffold60132_cov87-Phaeocystis_antarctica.AAC.1
MTMLWHEGGHVVPLLDGAIATALRRFLGAGARADSLSQEGTSRALPSHGAISTATRILSELSGYPVKSNIPLASLGLNSVQ